MSTIRIATSSRCDHRHFGEWYAGLLAIEIDYLDPDWGRAGAGDGREDAAVAQSVAWLRAALG